MGRGLHKPTVSHTSVVDDVGVAVRAAALTFLSRRLHLGAVRKVCVLQLSRSSPPARALMARRFAQGLKSCGPNFSGRKVADQLLSCGTLCHRRTPYC